MIRKRTLKHYGGHHASTPPPPPETHTGAISNRTGVDITSPGFRGRTPRLNYNFRLSPEATGFILKADSAAGTLLLTFPDGWHYEWSGKSANELYNLLGVCDPRYLTPSIPQGVVLTDHASAESALLHVTNHRAFRLLGTPGVGVKIAAPVGFDVEWNTGFDWSFLSWSTFDFYSGGGSSTWVVPSPVPSPLASV